MQSMFYECKSLTSLDLSKFNVQNVTTMKFMFYQCSSLAELKLFPVNFRNGVDISLIFSCCGKLSQEIIESFKQNLRLLLDNINN